MFLFRPLLLVGQREDWNGWEVQCLLALSGTTGVLEGVWRAVFAYVGRVYGVGLDPRVCMVSVCHYLMPALSCQSPVNILGEY